MSYFFSISRNWVATRPRTALTRKSPIVDGERPGYFLRASLSTVTLNSGLPSPTFVVTSATPGMPARGGP